MATGAASCGWSWRPWRRGQHDKLLTIFATIEERARHLEGFIRGYAHFAKLPMPRTEAIAWPEFVARLHSQIPFVVDGELPQAPAHFDITQMEQALLNLLKNAQESGSAADQVTLRVRQLGGVLRIEVMDRGSGLGLALAREIAEAHGGRISLGNREGGGLAVAMVLED